MIRRQLPNAVSIVRILLAPVIFQALLNREYPPALSWLVIAALTDFLDGGLARYLGVVSRTGAYLDPIADKILLSGTYLILGLTGAIPMWLTAIVFGRDGLMLLFIPVAMLAKKARDFPPTIWGKLSTVIQIFAAFVVILCGVTNLGQHQESLKTALYFIAAAGTLWSGADYLRIGLRILAATGDSRPD